tara:strand:- start:543 stop:890 length:348 start_codon:yes stop_codon:yes gene_type:complete
MALAVNMSDKFSYRPLPDCLTIQPSDIEGLGLFAVEDITGNTNLGISHIRSNRAKTHLNLIRMPLGGFINHSDKPNCVLVKKVNTFLEMDMYDLVTTVKVKSGEELTLKYSLTES